MNKSSFSGLSSQILTDASLLSKAANNLYFILEKDPEMRALYSN